MNNNKQSSVDKEFVPYEEALALKELGFNEPCFAMWQKNKKLWFCDKKKWLTNFEKYPDKDTLELHIKRFPHNVTFIDEEYKLMSCSNFTAQLGWDRKESHPYGEMFRYLNNLFRD
jgi:hypothetical protein